MKPLFTKQQVQKTVDDFSRQKEPAIIAELLYIGTDLVNKCKSDGSYHDRTGNLRSSIGCVVLKNGQIVKGVHFGGNEVGVSEGETFASELAALYPSGFVLVVYAGMHYALYVEIKGYSVLTSFMPDADKFIGTLKEFLDNE